jgi:hypothetical protein
MIIGETGECLGWLVDMVCAFGSLVEGERWMVVRGCVSDVSLTLLTILMQKDYF